MSFREGDRVRFKNDPEEHEYRVFLVNIDDTLDLRDETGNDYLDWIPQRLMERAPEPARIGDVYRGNYSGSLYFVVGKAEPGQIYIVDQSYLDRTMKVSDSEFHSTDTYTLVRSGKDLVDG